jgi:hypothetical protein
MATAGARAIAESSLEPARSVRLAFRLGESVLGIDVDDVASLRMLDEAYGPLGCAVRPARPGASLRRLTDGRLEVRYGRRAVPLTSAADPVPLRAAYHAVREIFARFASEQQYAIAMYGAVCAIDGGAVLLLGPTTVGKTLLALHLAHLGARFLGDETALLLPAGGEICALPRRPALRENALPLVPSPEMANAVRASRSQFVTERGRFWYALDARALDGIEPCARPYPLRAVCILRERDALPQLRPLEAPQALNAVAQRAYVRPATLSQVGALRRALRNAACFEMTLGAPDASAELLVERVRSCA